MAGFFSLDFIAIDKYFKRKEKIMKKFNVILGTLLLLGFGMVISSPAKAEVLNVGGGTWDYGLVYNWKWQQSQYSNFWHPNWHRSTALQDTTTVNSFTKNDMTYNGKRWQMHNTWSYAKTGYWYPWQWRSYYDYLNW